MTKPADPRGVNFAHLFAVSSCICARSRRAVFCPHCSRVPKALNRLREFAPLFNNSAEPLKRFHFQ